MTHGELLHVAAICTHPAEDTPRLAYADWLDENSGSVPCGVCKGKGRWVKRCRPGPTRKRARKEHCGTCYGTGSVPDGRAARAEFIRVQCELVGRLDGRLLAREYDLLDRHAARWLPGCFRWDQTTGLARHADEIAAHFSGGSRCLFRRGFVSALTLGAADFLAHCDKLLWHPTQTVECPTCEGSGNFGATSFGDGRGVVYPKCACDKGRVPRPCPETAQPVTGVTLTTPMLIAGVGRCDIEGIHGKNGYWVTEHGIHVPGSIPCFPDAQQHEEIVREALKNLWEWVDFDLQYPTYIPALNG